MLGTRRWPAPLLILASIAAGLCESAILALIAVISATLVQGRSKVGHLGPVAIRAPVNDVIVLGLIIACFRLVLQVLLAYLPALVCADVQAEMRRHLLATFMQASWSVQSRDGGGEFQDVMTSQVLQATQAVLQAATILSSGAILATIVGSALAVQPVAAIVVIAAASGVFALLRPIRGFGIRAAKALSAAQLGYASGIHEVVGVAEEAKVFGARVALEQRTNRLIKAIRDRFFTTNLVTGLVSGLYQGTILLLLIGGLGVLRLTNTGRLVSLGAVVLLLVRASSYGQQVQSSYQNLQQRYPFLDRVTETEGRYREAAAVRGTRNLGGVPSIRFEEVCYSYQPGISVLKDVSFAIEPGETVGIVGPTGAGKSSLVQLLLGLREPERGRYLLDREEAGSLAEATWTKAFAYVPQDPHLLHSTVAENIRFFRALDQRTVEEAARLAWIHDEISTWREGYDTLIGERADGVSGGQRQRICLARAIAGDPAVLILDEPTSALDPHSEGLIQQSLSVLKRRMTLVVVAHRLSTLSICDRVMVLRHGELEAFAPPTELVQINEFYRDATNSAIEGMRAYL